MATIKDTDYLSLSTRIRAMETALLSKKRMEQLLEARSDEEMAKVLSECGYDVQGPLTPDKVDQVLSARWAALVRDLEKAAPDKRLLEVFRVKYDYHNLKTLLKASALRINSDRLLMDAGRLTPAQMKEGVNTTDFKLPPALAKAAREGWEVLSATGDPQRLDFALDRAYFAEMTDLAAATGSDYLKGYVSLLIDAANLRCLVRALRMKKGADFLKGILFPGGAVEPKRLLAVAAADGAGLTDPYASGPLAQAADLGAAALGGGSLTAFERACDDAVIHYLSKARYVPFGEAPVVGYLAAVESELTNLRILLSGRMAGLDAETIRERLRESYV